MTEPLAFLNGNLIPQSAASLALNDAGFVFGATVTDLCRTFRHRLYRWDYHLARFRQSCKSAYLGVHWTETDTKLAAEKLIEHNSALIEAGRELALVLLATPGPVGYYLGQAIAPGEAPTFAMHTFPLPFARYRPWIEHGAHLATPKVRQIPAACVDPHIKQRSRMHWWLAEQEVHRINHGVQALLLDFNNCVTETASANFLIVKNGTIVSPPREIVLEGVSLKVVTELCGKIGIPVERRHISLEECYAADEAILTCTSYCLAGVQQLNNHVYPLPRPMLQRLHDAWSAEVGVDIHQQILAG